MNWEKNSVKTLVEQWFNCWSTGNFSDIPVSEDFEHHSPFGISKGKQAYLDLVSGNREKFLGYQFEILDTIYTDNKASVRYIGRQNDFELAVSEWFYCKNNLISKIYSYYHIGEIRPDRKLE